MFTPPIYGDLGDYLFPHDLVEPLIPLVEPLDIG